MSMGDVEDQWHLRTPAQLNLKWTFSSLLITCMRNQEHRKAKWLFYAIVTGSGRSASVYAVVTVVHHASWLGPVPLSPISPHTLPCPLLLISTLNKQHHSPFKWVCRFTVKLHSLARTTGAQRSWMRMRNSKNSCGAEVSTTNKDVRSNKRSFERNLLESNSSPEMILYNQSMLTHHPRLRRGVWIPLVS